MKRIVYLINIILGCSCLISCSKFLDEKVETSYTLEKLASTEEGLESLVNGIYQEFKLCGFTNTGNWDYLQAASGISIWGAPATSALNEPQQTWSSEHKFTRFANNTVGYEQNFSNSYKTIFRCNSLLSALDASPVSAKYKDEIKGETLFVRAMCYFWLVRIYGDVSLVTDVPESINKINKPRENFWVIYNLIISDLNEAESLMRPYPRMLEVTGNNSSGRCCNYAATAMRSLVYLTIGTLLAHSDDNFWLTDKRTPSFASGIGTSAEKAFQLSLSDAEKVIGEGPFKLAKSYADLFRWTKQADFELEERIVTVVRTDQGDGGSVAMRTLPQYYNSTSKSSSYGCYRPTRWLFQRWCEDYGGVKGTGEHNSDIYVECGDPRFNISLIHTSYRNNGADQKCYPEDTRILVTQAQNRPSGMAFYKKYYDPTFAANVGKADIYVMRFAEVYLIAAEACANLSNDPSDTYGSKAKDYVNVILERARKSFGDEESVEPRAWNDRKFNNKEDLINAIFWERCYELNGECHEYFDTHRMGAKWLAGNISVPKNKFLNLKEQNADECYYKYDLYGRDFQYNEDWELVRKGLICAYPYKELVYNNCLNPGVNDPNSGQNPKEVFWE